MAHVNNEYLIKICDDNLADDIQKTRVRKNFTCDICNLGEIKRRPHKKITKIWSKISLKLVYCDVCGPTLVTSLNGSCYMLMIVDDYSGMYSTYFLNHKSETLKNFILFKEKYENLINKKIKRVRTDNGRELDNTEFNQFLERNGITHKQTIPYNSESNGKVD